MDDRSARGAPALERSRHAPVLLYDGLCGFCAGSVRLILRHERQRTLLFAALQSPFGVAVRARHPDLAGVDSMIWLEPVSNGTEERVFVRSDAALRIAAYLGGVWSLAAPARVLPRAMRDRAYDFIARHRHRISGSFETCVLPSPGERDRFLD